MREPTTNWFLAMGVSVVVLALLLATEPRLAMVWDEGYTLGREARVRLWLRAMRDPAEFAAHWRSPRRELVQPDDPRHVVSPPTASEISTRSGLLAPRVLSWFWPFGREEPHGHPPMYAIVGLLGDVIRPSWPVLDRARLGPMLVFSLTAGVIFGFLRRRLGTWAAVLAVGAWLFQPRLFAHAHYATYDAILTSLWVGATLAFVAAVEREPEEDRVGPRLAPLLIFGLLLGWAMNTKLTGWFLPVPFVFWAMIRRDRRAIVTLLAGGVLATITLYAFNPPWWPAPIEGALRFFRSNLSRGSTIPIASLFLGRVYKTPNESLPWYNTLAWTVFVTPIGFLGFALVGVLKTVAGLSRDPLRPGEGGRRPGEGNSSPRPSGEGAAAQPPGGAIRAIPKPLTPPSPQRGEGDRTNPRLPGEGAPRIAAHTNTLAILACAQWAFLLLLRALPHTPGHDGTRQFLPAFGCLALVAGLGASWAVARWGRGGKALVLAAIAGGAVSTAVMMPVPLSYYSPLVGGLPGATKLGMEPTYYWDALDEPALTWLRAHTSPGHSVMFATNPTNWFYLRETGQLGVPVAPFEPGQPAWYVLQNRPGSMRPFETRLIEKIGPAHVIRSKLGVPLIWAFPFEAVEREAAR